MSDTNYESSVRSRGKDPSRRTDDTSRPRDLSAAAVKTRRVDALGDRLKDYERSETSRRAMKGVPLVVRVDGRGFSRFTAGMARPFEQAMADLMVDTAAYLLEQVSGALVAYTQSDEISLVVDPFGASREIDDIAPDKTVEFVFGGKFHKMTSVIAGLATARFVKDAINLWPERCARQLPVFDCRVFEVPNRSEAVAALAWREFDATKNAVSMAARAYFPHKELEGRSSREMQEMLFARHGINFNDYPARFKRGVYLRRQRVLRHLSDAELARIPEGRRPTEPVVRTETVRLDLPPISKVTNKVAVLLDGAAPVLATAG